MKAKRKTWIWTILLLVNALALPLVAADPISVGLVADGGEYYEGEARYGLVIGSVARARRYLMNLEGAFSKESLHLSLQK
jgi:hypothetical protein